MTRQGAPTPPPPPPSDTEYVRKLALAILGTLQTKGLLSADEVDTILITARRAAQGQPAPGQPAPAHETAAPPRSVMQVTAQPSAPPGHLSWEVSKPPATQDQGTQTQPAQETGESRKASDGEAMPLVIDIKLD